MESDAKERAEKAWLGVPIRQDTLRHLRAAVQAEIEAAQVEGESWLMGGDCEACQGETEECGACGRPLPAESDLEARIAKLEERLEEVENDVGFAEIIRTARAAPEPSGGEGEPEDHGRYSGPWHRRWGKLVETFGRISCDEPLRTMDAEEVIDILAGIEREVPVATPSTETGEREPECQCGHADSDHHWDDHGTECKKCNTCNAFRPAPTDPPAGQNRTECANSSDPPEPEGPPVETREVEIKSYTSGTRGDPPVSKSEPEEDGLEVPVDEDHGRECFICDSPIRGGHTRTLWFPRCGHLVDRDLAGSIGHAHPTRLCPACEAARRLEAQESREVVAIPDWLEDQAESLKLSGDPAYWLCAAALEHAAGTLRSSPESPVALTRAKTPETDE